MTDCQVLPLSKRIEDMERRFYAALGACDSIETTFHFPEVRALLEVSMEGRDTLKRIAKALRTAYQFDRESEDAKEWYWQPQWSA